MFEKEAKEYRRIHGITGGCDTVFKDGAEFGYNKANEWHDLRKNPSDLPKDRIYCVVYCGENCYDACLYNGMFITHGEKDVYAWKEIVHPELKESE